MGLSKPLINFEASATEEEQKFGRAWFSRHLECVPQVFEIIDQYNSKAKWDFKDRRLGRNGTSLAPGVRDAQVDV